MNRAGTILSDRGVIRVSGPETRDFLQGLVTNDIDAVTPDRAGYGALLTPQGKYLFGFFTICEGTDSLLLETERARVGDLVKRLTLYKLRAQVDISDASAEFDICAIWGGAPLVDGAPGAARAENGLVLYNDPRHLDMGTRLIVPAGQGAAVLAEAGASLSEQAAYDRHRLSLGVPEGPAELPPEKIFLHEAGLTDLGAVSFKKGCFVGQEVVARTHHKGKARKRLLPFELEQTGDAPPEAGMPVTKGGEQIGTVQAVCDGRGLAFVRLDRAGLDADHRAEIEIVAGTAGGRLSIPDWVNLPVREGERS